MAVVVRRFDATIGSEIQKSRPCLIISPDELNRYINTVIIARMTTQGRKYPTRVTCEFQGRQGQIVLDQVRTVNKSRLIKKLGRIDNQTEVKVLSVLHEMFSP